MEELKKEKPHFYIPENSPDAALSMGLGIGSIVANFMFPGLGLIFAIIGLVKSKKAQQIYDLHPVLYTSNSKDYISVGKITSIIGLVFSLIYVFFIVIMIVFVILSETGNAPF